MIRRTLITTAFLVLAATGAQSQTPHGWDPTGLQLTRAELEELLRGYEETATSAEYSGALRSRAREEAALIRQRLDEGDLRVGDLVDLVVENHTNLTNKFTVVAGRMIVLPDIGEVPLNGVLRSELQIYLTRFIAKYIVNPVVHARSMIRLEVLGAVGKPGFYMIPSDVLLSEALMLAGGPTGNAALDRVTIQRGRDVIWRGERLREAMIEGRTLDQLSVRAGDGIHVPVNQGSFPLFRTVIGALTTAGSLFWIARRTGLL